MRLSLETSKPMAQKTNITDLKEAILEAQAEMMELVREVMIEAIVPQVNMQGRKLWATMPDKMREQFKAERPNEYAELMKG